MANNGTSTGTYKNCFWNLHFKLLLQIVFSMVKITPQSMIVFLVFSNDGEILFPSIMILCF